MTMASGQDDDETLAGTSSEEPLSLSTPGQYCSDWVINLELTC